MLFGQLAVRAAAAQSSAIDYSALYTEMQSLKDDANVVRWLSRHETEAQRVLALEQTAEHARALAIEYRRAAAETRVKAEALQRRREFGAAAGGVVTLQAYGQALERAAAQEQSQLSDPIALELRAAEYTAQAREALVGLVSSYRAIKARAVARKQSAAPQKVGNASARSEAVTQSHGEGCRKDTDCKGDRICEQGSCVSLRAASQAP